MRPLAIGKDGHANDPRCHRVRKSGVLVHLLNRLLPARLIAALACGVVAGLTVTGCTGADRDTGTAASQPPAFTGPFAAEYTEAWQKSETPEVRTILEDGRISDQEWSQVLKTLDDCLTESGVTLVAYDEHDGSYEADVGEMSGDTANERMGICEKVSGEAWVGRLYRAQTTNPENIPETQLLTDCLIRNHAVPESYTVEQYLTDAPTMSFPYLDEHGPQTLAGCSADPDYVH